MDRDPVRVLACLVVVENPRYLVRQIRDLFWRVNFSRTQEYRQVQVGKRQYFVLLASFYFLMFMQPDPCWIYRPKDPLTCLIPFRHPLQIHPLVLVDSEI